MRRIAFLSTLTAVLLGCQNQEDSTSIESSQEVISECQARVIENQFIVQWVGGERRQYFAKSKEAILASLPLESRNQIEFIEPDITLSLIKPVSVSFEEDPVENWGQNTIRAHQLWSQGILGNGITIAVIDSGLDPNHPQLSSQLAINTNEVLDGQDSDGNGFIDDIYGWDFVHNTGVISDKVGHGTHVSGIIAANHEVGPVRGIAPEASILPLAIMGTHGDGALSLALDAIDYAVSRNVNIINASWGGSVCSQALLNRIQSLEKENILFVSAAGNHGVDLQLNPVYPAAFRLDSQITVGASSYNDFTAGFTNFSFHFVDILAPGVSIFSTYRNQNYSFQSGTSMSAPFVSGVAALLWSAHPTAPISAIKRAILEGSVPGPYPVVSRGRLDALKSYEFLSKEFLLP